MDQKAKIKEDKLEKLYEEGMRIFLERLRIF
jgi:hypothetical protein